MANNSKAVTKTGALALAALAAFLLSACHNRAKEIEIIEAPDLPQKVMPTAELEAQCNRLYHTNSHGHRISWKGALPITYVYDPSFPEEFIPAFEAAVKAWNDAAGKTLFQTKGRRASSLPDWDGVNTIYYISAKGSSLDEKARPLFGQDSTIAVSSGTVLGNQMVDDDIIFDGARNQFSSWRLHLGTMDLQATAMHELGHALGLTHNTDDELSIMFPAESSVDFSARSIDATSQKMIGCEY